MGYAALTISNLGYGAYFRSSSLLLDSNGTPALRSASSRPTRSCIQSDDTAQLQSSNLLKQDKYEGLEKSAILNGFKQNRTFAGGQIRVQAIREEHTAQVVELLTDSFAESMWGPTTYRPLLSYIVKENLLESRKVFPNGVVLVAENDILGQTETDLKGSCYDIVGTVEMCFATGIQISDPPTPTPPRGSPYLSNIAVKQNYRRMGIGWQLLQAAEDLARAVGCKEMYLHCRLIDSAPFAMYSKAGYKIMATDSIIALLALQRRRHLMRKVL